MKSVAFLMTVGIGMLSASAATTTNVWTGAAGDNKALTAGNWSLGHVPTTTEVIDLTQAPDGAKIGVASYFNLQGIHAGNGGSVTFGSTGNATENTLHTVAPVNGFNGVVPITVDDGTLTINTTLTGDASKRYRKDGAGTLQVQGFYTSTESTAYLNVREGTAEALAYKAFMRTKVKVSENASLTPFESYMDTMWFGGLRLATGSLAFSEHLKYLMIGGAGDSSLSVDLDSSSVNGTVASIYDTTLHVPQAKSGVTYLAREGDISFGSLFNPEDIVGWWGFDDPSDVGKDSGCQANHLRNDNVQVVDDPVRGKVAKFTLADNAALYGRSADGGVAGLPSGAAPFTVSLWVKDYAAQGALIGWGADPVVENKSFFMRVKDSGTVLGAFAGVGTESIANLFDSRREWTHVACVWNGEKLRLFVDGENVTEKGYTVNLSNANFKIGAKVNTPSSFADGLMDDLVIFSRALSDSEVMSLSGLSPATVFNGATIPSGAKLALRYNAKISMSGDQTFDTIETHSPRNEVAMPAGGSLTLTGDTEPFSFAGTFTGTGDFVKDGADSTVKLTGVLDHTGTTEVKAGVLEVGNANTVKPFVSYDFEDEDIGRDTSGNGRNLTVKSGADDSATAVTRVYDEKRGSYVAQFDSTQKSWLRCATTSNELEGNPTYTISFWAKASDDCDDLGAFLFLRGGSSRTPGKRIHCRIESMANNEISIVHYGYDFKNKHVDDVKAWHHYTFVHDGADNAIYVDGEMIYSERRATNGNTGGEPLVLEPTPILCLGSYRDDDQNHKYFDGRMDDVRIYNHRASAEDVKLLMAGGTWVVVPDSSELANGSLPAPALHYAFEDADNVGKDSSATGLDLVATGEGTLTLVDSPIGGKALKFDEAAMSYLVSAVESFAKVAPEAGTAYTVSYWVQPSKNDAYTDSNAPSFVAWGDPTNGNKIDFLSAYWYNPQPRQLRTYLRTSSGKEDKEWGDLVANLRTANDAKRFHHVAVVCDPAKGVAGYFDGKPIDAASTSGAFANAASFTGVRFYLGAKPSCLTCPFKGVLDEVKLYKAALTHEQIVEVIKQDCRVGTRVLSADSELKVDAGATVKIGAIDQPVGALTGAGAVEMLGGRLTVGGVSTFDGKIVGNGTLRLGSGAALTLTAANALDGFVGAIESAGGGLALSAGQTLATDVSLLDGAVFKIGADTPATLIETTGKVTLGGAVSLVFTDNLRGGNWTLVKCGELVGSLGPVSVSGLKHPENLSVTTTADGRLVARLNATGLVLIVR